MATSVQSYDKDRAGAAIGTGALGGLASGAATGSAAGPVGTVIGGLIGAGLGAATAGIADDQAQKGEIKLSQQKARAEQDATLDSAASARIASKSRSMAAADNGLIDAAAGSPYNAGNAYDSWHNQKWG